MFNDTRSKGFALQACSIFLRQYSIRCGKTPKFNLRGLYNAA